ncbi:hypothetical protein [Bacteroides neonati]|uniref:hypothetical protein n=1 Tax=Bacteroides neonati TaxID=1347393 RepID=UPI0004B8213E|nr:hypothetical protein [Bacteroides neonati]
MRRVVVICTLVLLTACSTKKVSTEQTDYTKLVSELRERIARYEKRMEVYRDSMVMVKGLLEKSSNVADSVSHLETSYAKSDAAIRGGRLHHSIENKDSIPSVVKYVFIEIEKTDTVFVAKIDTVYKDRNTKIQTVKEKKRFAGDFFYTSGCMAWLAVVGAGIWFLYKVKKGER